MTPEILAVVKFLLWLQRQGVVITIAPMLDREPNKVYKTPEDMLDLAARWYGTK